MNAENVSTTDLRNSGTGYLVVHVTTARGAIPLEGAQVNIRSYPAEFEEGRGDVISGSVSNRDGNTPRIALSAPARSESLTPTNTGLAPYASYNVEVFLEGYYTQTYLNIPIFDGITAIQPADLIPLSENRNTDSRTPDGERFFESTAPEL